MISLAYAVAFEGSSSIVYEGRCVFIGGYLFLFAGYNGEVPLYVLAQGPLTEEQQKTTDLWKPGL